MRERSHTVTIRDVAREAGISPATAGRVLGGYGYASDEVKARVEDAAERLGYRPNHRARSLITGKTTTIGVVGADIENPFFAGAMRGIGDVARERGYGAILTNSDENLDVERDVVRLLLEEQVDGIIVAPADVRDTRHLAEAMKEGTAVVVFDRPAADLDVDWVAVDHVAAARGAIEHLLDLGHRRIGIVAELSHPREAAWSEILTPTARVDPATLSPSGARLYGYLRAHWDRELDVDPSLVGRTGEYTRDSARQTTLHMLDLIHPPTALFTVDNLMSSGTYEALLEHGSSIPGDVSMIAFDDLDWMTYVRPPVTALRQPIHEMGAEAARLLLDRIEDPDRQIRKVILPAQLIERGSTRRI